MPRNNKTTAKQRKSKELSETGKKRQVSSALKELPDKYLACRSYRYHALKEVRLFRWQDGSYSGICRVSVCTRCGAHCEDYYNGRGERVEPRRYDLPDGYSINGFGYLTSDKIMREVFARAGNIMADPGDIPAAAAHLALVQSGS